MDSFTVESPSVVRVSFDHQRSRLRVSFQSGRVADFSDVPHAIFAAMEASDDRPAFFESKVRGHFAWRDVITAVLDGDAGR